MTLTPDERAVLSMYRPDTYCISLGGRWPGDEVRKSLETKGLIEWVPGQAWSGPHPYAITDAGKAARDAPG